MFAGLRSYFSWGLSLLCVDSFVVSVSVGFVVVFIVWSVTLFVVFVLFCFSFCCLFGYFCGLLGFDRAIFVN
jgi:hypothetical protein